MKYKDIELQQLQIDILNHMDTHSHLYQSNNLTKNR